MSFIRLAIVVLLLPVVGCSFFMPKHQNSFDSKGERIGIRALERDTMCRLYGDDYVEAFFDGTGERPTCKRLTNVHFSQPELGGRGSLVGAGAGAAVAAALLGLAVDQAEKSIRKEAENYEKQFRAAAAFEGFYEPTMVVRETPVRSGSGSREIERKEARGLRQRHFGFEIRRATEDSTEAYHAVFGIYYSEKNRLMQVAPLYFKTERAKAKVLTFRFWSVFWAWALKTGEVLESQTDVRMEAMSVDRLGVASVVSLGPPIRLDIKKYNLTKTPVLRRAPKDGAERLDQCPSVFAAGKDEADEGDQEAAATDASSEESGGGKTEEPRCFSGWMAPVPVSQNARGEPIGDGAYFIKAVVTEKDPSNAKKYLTELADQVRKQGDSLLENAAEKDDDSGDGDGSDN